MRFPAASDHMQLWHLPLSTRRFLVGLILGCFLPVVSAAYACAASCVVGPVHEQAHSAATSGDLAEVGSIDAHDTGAHHLHAGACLLAWTPAAPPYDHRSSMGGAPQTWDVLPSPQFASFLASPPEPRPKELLVDR